MFPAKSNGELIFIWKAEKWIKWEKAKKVLNESFNIYYGTNNIFTRKLI